MPLSCQSRGWERWNICSRQCSQHRGPTQTDPTETGKQRDVPEASVMWVGASQPCSSFLLPKVGGMDAMDARAPQRELLSQASFL